MATITPLRDHPDRDTIRIPPTNISAEMGLVGTILFDNRVYHQVRDLVNAGDLANLALGRIYGAATSLIECGRVADPVTLKNLFEQDPALAEVGGAQYLVQLMQSVVNPLNAVDYARCIRALAVRRAMIAAHEDGLDAAYQIDLERPVEVILDEHATRLRVLGASVESGLNLIGFAEMKPRLAAGYLIKNLFASRSMAVVYGESGTGKTFWTLHVSACIAAGARCFGHRVRQAGVVYVAAEAGRGIENRVIAYEKVFGAPELMPFAAITSPIDLCGDGADLRKLIATIRAAPLGMPVELVVIDTLSRVMGGGNENAPDDMGALVRNLDALRADTGAAVLLVHHSGKNPALGARGHSLLRAATDTEIEIIRDAEAKISTARVTKQREFETHGTFTFTLRTVDLGIDEDGDFVGSCVVEEAEGGPVRRPEKLTGAALLGFEQLKSCMADNSEEIEASSHIPAGIRGVTLTYWRSYLEQAGVINADGNPREQFRRIRVTLQGRGYIGVWNDYVWLSHSVTGPSQ